MKTIQKLIEAVQDRISLPLDDDDRWSTAALVNAFNNALEDRLTPDLISQQTNYLVQREVFPLKTGTTTNYPLNAIPIPSRAAGRVLREVKFIPTGTSIDNEVNCLIISLEDKDKYIKDPAFYGSSVPYVFVENDSLRFIGGNNTGSIVMYYSIKPSTLVNTTGRFGTITNITYVTATTSTITASPGAVWSNYIAENTSKFVDIYRKSTGSIIKSNVQVTRGSGGNTNVYTINTSVTSNEITQIKTNQAGPWPVVAPFESDLLLLPAGESEFSTLPYEYDQLLVLYTCERVLESLGDTEGLQVVMTKTKETADSIARLSSNRIQGENNKLEDRRSVSNVQPRSIQALILDVYDRIRVPIDQDPRWTTPAIIRAFNTAMVERLAPDLVAEGSNYLIQRDVVPLTVNGSPAFPLNAVPIPRRAIARSIREVKYLPQNKTKLEDELNCPAISLEEKDMYGNESEFYGSSVPYIFIENDNIRLVGGDIKGSLVIYYNIEPSKLTLSYGRFAEILRWTGTTNNGYTIEEARSSGNLGVTTGIWESYINYGQTKLVDIYCKSTGAILKTNVSVTRGDPSDAFTINNLSLDEIKQIKANQTGGFPTVGGITYDLSQYQPELMLIPAGECELLTIPEEYDQLLVLYVCSKILESVGDTQSLQIVDAKIQEARNSIVRVTGNRLQGERRRLTDRRSIARIQRGQKWTRNYNRNYN